MEFLEHHSLYVVAIIVAVVWAGIFFFMMGVDRRVRRIEKEGGITQ
jgi:CcmD family protein